MADCGPMAQTKARRGSRRRAMRRSSAAGACEVSPVLVEVIVFVTVGRQVTVAQPGNRPKAATSSSAHGQLSAMRKVIRRAERTSRPAACSNV